MNETEVELLEILRKMRALADQGNTDVELRLAAAYLCEALSVLAGDTLYSMLALKIVAQYAAKFEEGAVT